jgi:hypothetical protein
MRQEFKHLLISWKNDIHPGETKKVFVSTNPLMDGEFIIRLEQGLTGNLNYVTVSEKFFTESQQDGHKDSSSDISHLHQVIHALEIEFNDLYEKTMHETFADRLTRYAHLN